MRPKLDFTSGQKDNVLIDFKGGAVGKICYEPRGFQGKRAGIIDNANKILEEYAAQGYRVSCRQLFYQFVQRGLIENTTPNYNAFCVVLGLGRMAGIIDWDHIEDRTRALSQLTHWSSPKAIVEACVPNYRVDKWSDQGHYIEVWVEKEALAGVLEAACEPLDVAFFPCRGYSSTTAMHEAAMRLIGKSVDGRKARVLYLGDHDPRGLDMSRDIPERLAVFMKHHDAEPAEVTRLALNYDQVLKYNPPPNVPKPADSKYKSYIEQFGTECWELDALEPAVIRDLITDAVLALRDEDRWAESVAREEAGRQALAVIAEKVI